MLASGRVPWDEPVALQGPPMLGRSGMALRGLAAVLAWQVGGKLPEKPLAWRLLPANTSPPDTSFAVLRLAANGGEALYRAVPDPRARRLSDGPERWWGPEQTEIRQHIETLCSRNAGMRAMLGADLEPVCSLAVALSATFARARKPQGITLPGPWTPARITRVATMAQLVADDFGYRVKERSYWKIRKARPSRSFWRYKSDRAPDQRNRWLEHLCRSGLVASCLPAELRELSPEADALAPPDLPVRASLFRCWNLRRAPAIGTLAAQIPSRELPPPTRTDVLRSTLSASEWLRYAIRGLELAEHLGCTPTPSEPGHAWRAVGRALRADLHVGGSLRWLTALSDDHDGTVQRCWRGLVRRHRAQSWLHPTPRATLEHLRYRGRFQVDDLSRILKLDPQEWSARGAKIPVRALPSVALAALRQARRQPDRTEQATLNAIAAALGADRSWPSVSEHAERCTWERQARPKRSGGTRWLDVPPPALRDAQGVVASLLLAVFPRHAWLTAFHPGGGPVTHARAHAGARAAAHADIHDFFGSLHPWHLEPWLGLAGDADRNLLPGWSDEGRRALLRLAFHQRGGLPYLPQGAPCSPVAANLAGLWLDHAILRACVARFGEGGFTYTRYADDLVVSTSLESREEGFGAAALEILGAAANAQGLALKAEKSWTWATTPGSPLVLGGLRVPSARGGKLRLDRDLQRRARATLHRLRHRLDYLSDPHGGPVRVRNEARGGLDSAHGLMAYAYVATGDPRWLAYTSVRLARLARLLAGPLFSESLLAGWSDEVRVEEGDPVG